MPHDMDFVTNHSLIYWQTIQRPIWKLFNIPIDLLINYQFQSHDCLRWNRKLRSVLIGMTNNPIGLI